MTTTIRISLDTHRKLCVMARQAGSTLQQVVEQALETYRRQRLLAATNAAYAALAAQPEAWRELEAERAGWDATLADGLVEE